MREGLLLQISNKNLVLSTPALTLILGAIVVGRNLKLILLWFLHLPLISLRIRFTLSPTTFLTDHRAVSASYCVMGPSKTKAPRTRRHRNRCGKWRVDGSKAVGLCNKLAEKVELQGRDFNVEDLQALSDSVSFRPKTYRYKDPDHILQLIKQENSFKGLKLDSWVKTYFGSGLPRKLPG